MLPKSVGQRVSVLPKSEGQTAQVLPKSVGLYLCRPTFFGNTWAVGPSRFGYSPNQVTLHFLVTHGSFFNFLIYIFDSYLIHINNRSMLVINDNDKYVHYK